MGMDVMAKMLRLAGQAMTEGFGFHHDKLNVCAKVVNRMSIVLGDVVSRRIIYGINYL
jgi:hypothetical protein